MHMLAISFMWYLKKNFLEMFSMYKDNKTHHSSSRTYQSVPSHAILEEIKYKKKICHSNPQSPLPHFNALNDWSKPISAGIVQITYTTKEQRRLLEEEKNGILNMGLEIRNPWVPMDNNSPDWLALDMSMSDVYDICLFICLWLYLHLYICLPMSPVSIHIYVHLFKLLCVRYQC